MTRMGNGDVRFVVTITFFFKLWTVLYCSFNSSIPVISLETV